MVSMIYIGKLYIGDKVKYTCPSVRLISFSEVEEKSYNAFKIISPGLTIYITKKSNLY